MNRFKPIIAVFAVAVVTTLAACGGSSYRSGDIYSSGYGLTYVDACNMGIYDACVGLYGRSYYSSGHPGYRRPHYARLTPSIYGSYATSHPTIRQRVAATKQRIVVAKQKAVVKAKAKAAAKQKSKSSTKSSSSFSKPKTSLTKTRSSTRR